MTAPFMKCAGGKRRVASKILKYVRADPGGYYEPFLGGGAVFFALSDAGQLAQARRVVLSDINEDLVALWQAVALHLDDLVAAVGHLTEKARENPEAAFYAARDAWNRGHRTPEQQLYLRANGFNGLWRENKKGELNTPWARCDPRPYDPGKLRLASIALQRHKARIRAGDFSAAVRQLPPKSLIYLDPPYLGSWVGYHKSGWDAYDVARLLQSAALWSSEGHQVIFSHADTPEFDRLQRQHWPGAHVEPLVAPRTISCAADGRKPADEVLLITRT